jgi:HD-GYP domain-containing protein (c-di-GMP phosphodiesterase class II)
VKRANPSFEGAAEGERLHKPIFAAMSAVAGDTGLLPLGGSRTTAELDPEAGTLIAEQRARRSHELGSRGRLAAALVGGGFLAAAIPLALLTQTGRSPHPVTVIVLIGAYAIASRVEFELAPGAAVPTQLVLVPMLFLVPIGWVPLAVACGLLLGRLSEHIGGKSHLERAALTMASSWHALGPACVLALAGERDPSLSDWPLYVGALAAQFALDLAAGTAYARLADGISPSSTIRLMGWVYLVDLALSPVGLLVALVAVDAPAAFVVVLPLVGLLDLFARERTTRIDHALELSQAYRGTAFLLGDVIEADDEYTGSHSRDVVELSVDVAEELQLDARAVRQTELVALLHDVGKIRIPGEIINKPGPLTDEERAIIELHTIEGERMLERVGGLLGEVGRIVRSCHERWDGGGYPDKLAGENIAMVARIVCCCDAYSAITTDRPYRAARTVEEAIVELRRSSGTHFDPQVVDALIRVIERG